MHLIIMKIAGKRVQFRCEIPEDHKRSPHLLEATPFIMSLFGNVAHHGVHSIAMAMAMEMEWRLWLGESEEGAYNGDGRDYETANEVETEMKLKLLPLGL